MEKEIKVNLQKNTEANPKLPSWKDSEADLSESQRSVAEIAFFRAFLEKANQNAQDQLPSLREKNTGKDKAFKSLHVMGLVDAYFLLPQGEEGREKFEAKWREKSDYLVEQVDSMLPELEEERDKIFSEAKEWEERDQKKQIKGAYRTAQNLPQVQRSLLYQTTDLAPEKKKDVLTRWGVTVGLTVGSTLGLDILASSAGTGLVNMDILQSLDTKSLAVILGASYISWGLGMRSAIKANKNSLEETGLSTNVFSKFAFDHAKTEKGRRFGVTAGYVGWEAAKEIPYYAGAISADLAGALNTKEAIIFLAGANLFAAGYEKAQALGINAVVKRIVQRPERRKKKTENSK